MPKTKKEEKEENYFQTFVLSLIATLIIHFLLLSKVEMHPTLHVLIALCFFIVIMGIIILIKEKRK